MSAQNILYSVVIPTHNRCEQLALTLAGLETQTFADFEVVVVNDGSTDDSAAMLHNYAGKLQLEVVTTGGLGAAGARNCGIERARGDMVLFCDADFLARPHMLARIESARAGARNRVVSAFPRNVGEVFTHIYPGLDDDLKAKVESLCRACGTWGDAWSDAGQLRPLVSAEQVRAGDAAISALTWQPEDVSLAMQAELARLDVAPWMVFITRCVAAPCAALQRCEGFDTELLRGEDWELGYRLAKIGLEFATVDEVLGHHQSHPRPKSYRMTRSGIDFMARIFQRHGTEDPQLNLAAVMDINAGVAAYKNSLRFLAQQHPEGSLEADAAHVLQQASTAVARQKLQEARDHGTDA